MNANAAPLVGYAVVLGENGLLLKLATQSKLGQVINSWRGLEAIGLSLRCRIALPDQTTSEGRIKTTSRTAGRQKSTLSGLLGLSL